MQEKLGQRLVFFGRIIVVVWLLSVAAWLQKLDSLDLRDDVRDPSLLAAVDDIPSPDSIRSLPDTTFDHALSWLDDEHPDVAELRVDAREQVVAWLFENGVSEVQLRAASGKFTAPVAGAIPFHFLRVEETSQGDSMDTEGDSWHSAPVRDGQFVVLVSDFLHKLDRLAKNRELTCVVGIDEQTLSTRGFEPDESMFDFELSELTTPSDEADRIFEDLERAAEEHLSATEGASSVVENSPPAGRDDRVGNQPSPSDDIRTVSSSHVRSGSVRLIIESALLEADGLRLAYSWFDPEAGPTAIQTTDGFPVAETSKSLIIPVSTRIMHGPTLLRLSDPQRHANTPLQKLAASSSRMAYLHRTYGHLPLEEATFLASEGLTQGYRQLGLFGITFSTRRYPLAVMLCLSVALGGSLVVLISARERRVSVVQQVSDDYAVDILIASWPARFVLWGILPLSALWASLPVVPLNAFESGCVHVGAGAFTLLACASLYLAGHRRRAYRR